MMKREATVKRPYQSPLRRAQALSTRQAIVEAGARLFVAHGYGGASMDDIAAAAGVSRATVFTSVGGKAAILKAAYDIAIVGDDEPIPLPQRPWALAVRNEPDAYRMVDKYAHMITEISSRVAPVYEAMRGATGSDPEVLTLWQAMRGERRGGAAGFVGFIVARDALRPELDRKHAADIVWVLNDPAMYHLLVHERSWSPTQFQRWLADTLKAQLLRPAGRKRPARQ